MAPRLRYIIHFLLTAILLTILAASLASCRRKEYYDQSSADATIQSLAEMVRNGDIGRLPELVRSNDENLNKTLKSAGIIFERIQLLSDTLKKKFPDEVDELIEKAKTTATEEANKVAKRRGQTDWGERLQTLFIDPSGAIDDFMSRATVAYADDETYALLIDGQPAFGIGIILKQNPENQKWYLNWPDNLTGMVKMMPQTDAEWMIIRSMLKSISNGVRWTERGIREDKIKQLDDVWQHAAMNVAPNVVVQWLIYEQAVKKRPKKSSSTPQPSTNDNGG